MRWSSYLVSSAAGFSRLEPLKAPAQIHELVINALVYAELAVSYSTIEWLIRTIATIQLTLRD